MILCSPFAGIDINEVGAKAFNLINLKIKNTPNLLVIPASFFADEKNKAELQKCIEKELHGKLSTNKKYAVRSSAVGEDSENASFAGVHDSYLNISKDEVAKLALKVYESAFSERALEYRKQRDLPLKDIKIAVIIQEMVDADYSGVAFTINPVTNNPDEIIISLTKGLGEKLVSGEVSGSTYTVNGENIKIKGEPLLTKKQLKRLLELINEVSLKTTTFQDIEFAIKDNKVYFLQARPIVNYSSFNPHERDLIIDNANIIESYFGYTSYLTYTFAKSVYEGVYTATLQLGKTRKKIMDNLAPSLAEMLYYHEGKIYYNMKSWYKVNSIFSFKKSSSYMENMMGVKSKVSQIKRVKMNVFDMAKLGVLFCSKLLQLDSLSKRFVENFNRIVLPYYGRDISGSNAELFDLYKSIENDIVKEFAIPVINDCAVMIYFGSLKEKAKKLGVLEEEINLYINNNGQVDSAGSATMLIKIVSLINEDKKIKEDFINLSPAKLYEKYHANSSISPLLNEYILKYGPRVRDELKLETVTMIEDKTLLYKLIKDNLLSEINSFTNDSKRVQIPKKLRKSAEKAKKYIRNRENLRLYRTYVYSVVRNIFLAYAKNYLNEGRINEINDIFYLSKEEVLTGVGDFKAIIQQRKAQKDLFINAPTYKRIVFFNGKPLPIKYSEESSGLKGIPSGCGCVKARVSLMNDVSDQLKPGNIILTKRTDPGWISLFPKASGLVVEHGSMLSHSFVVARELNLPAVVGVENATEIIKDNDLIVLDGNKGEITIENN